MYFIDQKADYIFQANPLFKVDRAGRTCYQSKQADTYEDAANFAQRALKSGHMSIFEHVIFCFVFKENLGSFFYYTKLLNTVENDPFYSRTVNEETVGTNKKHQFYAKTLNEENGRNIISINFRFLFEAFEHEPLLANLLYLVYKRFPELFLEPVEAVGNFDNIANIECLTSEEFQMLYEPHLNAEEIKKHIYFSFVLQTDRGVMAELTRHRRNAFSVSSTRYINFSKKYGGIPIVQPVNFELTQEILSTLYQIEDTYRNLVNDGMPPQDARLILPNCLWCEIFTTANLEQWLHVFEMRLAQNAHPQIRALMEDAKNLVNENLLSYTVDMKTMGLVHA